MLYWILIALTAFVILVGGLFLALAKRLPGNEAVRNVVQIIIVCEPLAALILFLLLPMLHELRGSTRSMSP